MGDTEYKIPPFLRKEAKTPHEHARWYLEATGGRIAWLAERGLRPHARVLENRQHCIDFLEERVPKLNMENFVVSRFH